ncbi:MAG: beta-lactamase regulating signal transducer with metallopeptidase domain [Planctomycetota bacterium]|jgi:beta-lactamase regulating signal transducer with metallopeptidase domain
MLSSQAQQQALAWVLTYALHSTLLLSAAWLITRMLSNERIRWRERIWKTALVGGLFSASLQLAFNVAPLAGRLKWTLDESVNVTALPHNPGVLTGIADMGGAGLEFSWERLLVGAWMLGGLLGLALFLFAWRRITDRLAGRRTLREGQLKESLDRIVKRAGLARSPRLSTSNHLRSPATVGVFFPQICVPKRALLELPPDQQEALLAHELAHILRRDPLWFFVCGIIERVMFFQPLNRMARRELEEIAEFLSDDWAAQNTQSEISLARCLTEVATWVLDLRPVVAVVPMASRNSRLAARIGRLLNDDRRPQDHGHSKRAWALPLSTLGASVLMLPGAAALAEVQSLNPDPIRHPTPPAAQIIPDKRQPVQADLDEMLQQLDGEVEHLGKELVGLSERFEREQAPGGNRMQALTELSQRVNSLRTRRERLNKLWPALQRDLQHTVHNQSNNSIQEESR